MLDKLGVCINKAHDDEIFPMLGIFVDQYPGRIKIEWARDKDVRHAATIFCKRYEILGF